MRRRPLRRKSLEGVEAAPYDGVSVNSSRASARHVSGNSAGELNTPKAQVVRKSDPATYLLQTATVFNDLSLPPTNLDFISLSILLYVASLESAGRRVRLSEIISFAFPYGCTLTIKRRVKRLRQDSYLATIREGDKNTSRYVLGDRSESLLNETYTACMKVVGGHSEIDRC